MTRKQLKRRALNQRRYLAGVKGQQYLKSKARAESTRQSNRKRDRIHRAETVRKLRKIKLEKGCLLCGFKGHHAALQFHHRNPRFKRFRLGDGRNYSWKAVLREMAKCDVLCANCHYALEHDKRIKKGISEN